MVPDRAPQNRGGATADAIMTLIDRLRTAALYVFRGQKAIIGLPYGSDGVADYPSLSLIHI